MGNTNITELKDSLSELKEKEKILKKQIQKAEGELIPIEQRKLASFLHVLLCKSDHSGLNDCDYYQDKGDWKTFHRKYYLRKAKQILDKFSFDDTYNMIRLMDNTIGEKK